jgi:flagellar basal body rod protein FlgC
VDMIGASRAYEANIAAFNTVKGMMTSALQIGKA